MSPFEPYHPFGVFWAIVIWGLLLIFLVVLLTGCQSSYSSGPNANSIDKRCKFDEKWEYIPALKREGCKWQKPGL